MEAQDYKKLVKALRCKRDDCEGCDLAFFDKDEGWMCRYAAKDDDAADALESAEQRIAELDKELGIWAARSFEGKIGSMALINLNLRMEISKLQAQLQKRGEIVRCGECKWYGIYYAKKDGTPDKRYSPSVCLRGKYAKRRDPDWFCADGEREVQDD